MMKKAVFIAQHQLNFIDNKRNKKNLLMIKKIKISLSYLQRLFMKFSGSD